MKLDKILLTILAFLAIIGGYLYYSQKRPHIKTIFTFIGAPGSGKGTLAEQCVKKLGFTTLSPGNLLREAVARGDELGKQIQVYMKEGKLVSDELVTSIVANWLSKNIPNIDILILDGFPRTVRQAELFLELLRTKFTNASLRVIELIIPDEVIIKRLADRLVCEKCQAPYSRKLLKDPTILICESCGGKLIQREDDKEEIVCGRLKIYAEHAKPLLDIYRAVGLAIDQLNVEGKSPQQVFHDFKKLLKETKTLQKVVKAQAT